MSGLGCGPCAPGLITRGFIANTIITQGLGECPPTPIQAVVEAVQQFIRGKNKQLQRIIVTAKLLTINDEELDKKIQGNDIQTFYEEQRYSQPRVVAKWISNVVKNVINRIVINASKLFGINKN